jgi:hypothetical protein
MSVTEHEYVGIEEGVDVEELFRCLFDDPLGPALKERY